MSAPAGRVTIHDMKMLPTTRILSAAMPRAKPTPSTAPTSVWVVDTGSPVNEASTTVVAADSSAEKPRLGVSSVMRLPMVRMTFASGDAAYPVIIPPTYATTADDDVQALLENDLRSLGYRLEKVRLPEKLLAVRSGLAAYGKNNITYVPEMGSFHRTLAFISDLPCHEDTWKESSVLERCEHCNACATACPSGAIGSERFLLHAERCITFQNERPGPFADWINAAWHNSLVGCMICQKVCPANRKMTGWVEEGEAFDDRETGLILESVPAERLPAPLVRKFNRRGMMDYYHLLGRNLRVLMDRQDRASGQ